MPESKKDAPAVKEGEGNTAKPEVKKVEGETVGEVITPAPEEGNDADKQKQIAQDQRKRAEKAEAEADQLKSEINKLKNSAITGGKSIGEINDEIRRLSSEHNVDEKFLANLVSTIRTATTKEIKEELEKEYSPKLTKIEQDRNFEKANKKFDEIFKKSVKDMPEYDGIVNQEVIRALAFNPANAKKTLPQIIEEVYGSAVVGKKSIETSNASREQEIPNTKAPSREDWDKIQSDPNAKKKWAEDTEQELKRWL